MARILVVDDQPHVTLVLGMFLRRHEHEVTRAENGAAALELLSHEPFNVLITDVDMPLMDGLTLVQHRDVIANLAGVIVLTGRTDHEKLAKMKELGHVSFHPKPFSPSRIVAQVDEFCQLAELAGQPNRSF